MSETVFFSYSRADSEFVLNLAKNLRSAGANIWLDQLDIKPGSRWDKSIEKALDSSTTLLVVLSKSAVASTNVLDEVSFALEEGKNVVPVLLETCTIPFRLRRLQFADFSKDPKKGIKTLIGALNLNEKVATKLSDVALSEDNKTEPGSVQSTSFKETKKPVTKSTPKPVLQASTEESVSRHTTAPQHPGHEKRSKSIWPYLLVGMLIVAIAGGYYFRKEIFVDNEKNAWEIAVAKNTMEAFKEYQTNYPKPKGKYYDQAELRINKLQDDAWTEAEELNIKTAYESYLLKFKDPNGTYYARANQRINELNQKENERSDGKKQDSISWARALELNNKEGYKYYIDNKTSYSEFVSTAVDSIESISQSLFVTYATQSIEDVNDVNSDDGDSTARSETIKTAKPKEASKDELEESAWKKATDTNTFDGYISFVKSKENQGTYLSNAVESIKRKGKTGWLYVGRTNDHETYSRDAVVSVIYRKNSSITNLDNVIPKVGDIVVLNGTLGRRTYPKSAPRNKDESTGLLGIDKKAYISEVKMEGNTAIIAKIIYN